MHHGLILFRLRFCTKNLILLLQRPTDIQNQHLSARQTLLLPMVLQHLRVFFGRHSKSSKIMIFTLLLAQASGRFKKIIEIYMPVARVWGTSGKHSCLRLKKYADRIQKYLLNTTKFNEFHSIFDTFACFLRPP